MNYDVKQYENSDTHSQSLDLAYDFEAFKLESITTHQTFTINSVYDADFGNRPLYAGLKQLNDQEHETWTQELRASSRNQEGFRWMGGLYFEKDEQTQDPFGFQFPSFDMTDPNNPVFIGNYEFDAKSTTESTTQAAFGQIIVPLFTQLELTLGARLQRIEKTIDLDTFYLPVGRPKNSPFYELNTRKEWDSFLPKVALAYQINSNWNSYLSYAKGYMPGGFNSTAQAGDDQDNTFDPQISDSYELGVKTEFERLRFAANVFYMNIQDTHVFKTQGNLFLTDNAERSHSYGTEFEVSYLVTDDFELSGSAGFLEAKYDDYDTGSYQLDGKHMANAPTHTIRLSAAYSPPEKFYTRLDVYNQGDIYYLDSVQQDMVKEGPHTLTDVKLGYRLKDWDFYGYVKNLTDEKYIDSFSSDSMLSLASFGQPRRFGAGVRYSF